MKFASDKCRQTPDPETFCAYKRVIRRDRVTRL